MRYGFKEVVIDSRTGLNPRKNFVLGNGENNYITIKDIYNGQINITDKTDKVDDDAIQIIKKRSRIKVGDILFVSIGRIGETAIVKTKDDTWDVNESVFVFTINREIITPEYFCMLFQSDAVQRYLAGNSSGSTFKSIKMNRLEKMIFDIPPLKDQEEITTKLSKVKALCNLRASELAQLDCLIKARFVEMFGDPISNNKGWSTASLTDICSRIYGGGTPSKSHPEYFEGSIPWVSPKDMKSDVITDSIDHITEDAIANSTTNLVPEGSVLMVIRSGILKHNLPVAINAVPVTINQDMKAFVPGESITASFLRNYFKAIEPDVLAGVRGVTADNIDFKAFQRREVIMPPIYLQSEFEDFCRQIDKSKVAVQKALDETQLLFESLMQNYFG